MAGDWGTRRDSGAGAEIRGVESAVRTVPRKVRTIPDVAWARIAVVSRVPAMPKGARHETPKALGVNNS